MRIITTLILAFLMVGALDAPRQDMIVFDAAFDASKTIGSITQNQSISLSQDLILVGESDGWVRLYDSKKRATVWWMQAKGGLSAASIIGTQVMVSSLDGRLYAVDSKTGKVIWQKQHQGYAYKKPIQAPCGVFIQSANQQILCYDIATGSEKFITPLGGLSSLTLIRSYTPPVVQGNKVFVASDAGSILKVDGLTGKILQKSAPVAIGNKFKGIIGELKVTPQFIVFGEYGGMLVKLETNSMKTLQGVPFGRLYDVKFSSDSVLLSAKNGLVKSLKLPSLEENWSYKHDENVSHLAWVAGAWYGAGSRGSLFSLDISGKPRWRDFLDTEIRQDIFACGSSVCFSSASSSLYSYRL